MENKTHWKKLENPDYLGSYAFQPGQEMIVQIKSVTQEEIYNPSNNSKEVCTVLHFVEKVKPMILNATNSKTISKIYDTPYIEDWARNYITIYVAKVKAFGYVVEALRIRPKKPNIEKFVCTSCKKEIVAVGTKSAKEIADLSRRDYGSVMCVPCCREKIKKKAEEVKKDE